MKAFDDDHSDSCVCTFDDVNNLFAERCCCLIAILQLNIFLAQPQHVDLGHHGRVVRNHVAMERGQESSFDVINVNPRKTKTVTSVSI